MTGKVYLIGAGCGDADLITLKGLKKLLESDVVLYDSLVDEELINKMSKKFMSGNDTTKNQCLKMK